MSALDRALVRGVAWSGIVKWTGQIISWVSTIIVARLLTPADYGLVAMGTTFMGILLLLNEFGLGATVTARRDLSTKQLAQLNTVALLISVLAMLIMMAAAYPLARFYGSPELPNVMLVLGLGFLISALRTVPRAIMERELQFKTVVLIDGLQVIVTVSVSLALAWFGHGYWSLVIGPLAGSVFSTIALLALKRCGFSWPRRADLSDVIGMSWHLVGSQLSWYVASTSDQFIIGRTLGSSAMGAYQLAFTLANMPIEKIVSTVNRVMPAIYSAVQTDMPAMRRYLLGSAEMVALVVFPVAVGLALVAEETVLLLLGDKWIEAVLPLVLLSFYTAVRSVISLTSSILVSLRETRIAFWNGIWCLVLFPPLFYLGSRWGLFGVAAAWLVAHPLASIAVYRRVFKRIELRRSEFAEALWPATSACIAMAITVIMVKKTTIGLPLLIQLLIHVAAGAVAYSAILLIFHRKVLARIVKLLKLAKG